MVNNHSMDTISINTIVGAGAFIHGDVKIAGFVRIDGDIDGNLETPGRVIIGENARIRGDIQALKITIGGVVQGDVVAPEGVTILSSGMVMGTIVTKQLCVEDSVILHGPCFAINNEARFAEALAKYNNRKAYVSSSYGFSEQEH